ncbi:MAG: LacI family DNA-binding transcriptional regulator [Bacillaceae bacterium]
MVTIKDLAKRANVSVTTVSRALNGYSDVSEKTRKRILQLAEEMNYTPNALARSLVTKETKVIGCVLSSFERSSAKDGIIYELMCGINDSLTELGYDFVILTMNTMSKNRKSLAQLVAERRVDGLIVQGFRVNDPAINDFIQSDTPSVFIDMLRENKNVSSVSSLDVDSAKQAVRLLLHKGHRNIVYISGHEAAEVSKQRLEGYKQALEEFGIPFREEYVLNGQFLEEVAYKQMVAFLLQHPEVTACFAGSDLMAIGAIKACKELNKKIPEDISIIGFDDIPLASYVTPPLTTIQQKHYEKGYEAAKLVVELLQDKVSTTTRYIQNELVIRDSVGNCPEK